MENKSILILKLSQKQHIFGLNSQQILELASKPFRISPQKSCNTEVAYLTYQKQIIAKFEIIDSITKRSNNFKTNFILKPIKSTSIGKILNIRTSNTAFTITPETFKSKLLN